MVDERGDASSIDHPLVPGWLVRLAAIGWRVLVTLALGVVLFGIAGQLATVAASIILGLILAATLAPYVTERRARGWGAAKAAGVVMLAALLVLGAVVAAVILAVVPSLGAIVAAFDAGIEAARTQLTALGVPSELTGFMQRISDAIRGLVLGGLNDFVAAAANTVTIAILGGFLTFFLLMDGDKAWDWVLASTDGWRRDALMSGGLRALDQVGGYIRGTSLMAVANALLAGVVMLVFGVPLAGPLAVVALLAAFVPYVGRALTAVLIVTVILATRGVVPAAVFLLLYVLGSIALERVLARIASGRRLDLHPILAVLGLPIGFALGGFSGLVVVLPVLAFAQTAASVLITTLGREPIAVPALSATSASDGLVPVWLDRLGQWSWRALVVAALFVIVAQVALLFPGVIMPVVMAVILAATLAPAAAALERRGLSRTTAAMGVTVGTSVAIIAVVVLTLASLVGPMAELVGTATAGAESSGAQAVGIGSLVGAIGDGLLSAVTGAVANIVGVVLVLLLGGFLTFYFIRDGGRVWQELTAGVPADRRGMLDDAGHSRRRRARRLHARHGGDLRVRSREPVGHHDVLLGLPLGAAAGRARAVRRVHPLRRRVHRHLPGVLRRGRGRRLNDIVVMFIYTIVFNIIQGNFVTPLVYGKAVSLHPAIVLLAVPIGNALAGIVGMFLVVPVAGVIATTWRAVLQTIDAGDVVVPEPLDSPGPDVETEPAVPGVVVGG